MRIGVLDVGSQAVNLVVTETGARPDRKKAFPARSWKVRTYVAKRIASDGTIDGRGRDLVTSAVASAMDRARRAGVDEIFAYGTAAIRDCPNRDQMLGAIEDRAGIRLGALSGIEEAELTFLAARSWLGRDAGQMLLLDIGGGTLEVASGEGQVPLRALSLPMGAGRLTREFLDDGDPPSNAAVRRLHRHVRGQLREVVQPSDWPVPRSVVAASRTFYQLSRLTGAVPMRHGQHRPRFVQRKALRKWIERLSRLPTDKRQHLPGVSAHRAHQILAGAIVAYELLEAFGEDSARICPWGLREGILLRRLAEEAVPVEDRWSAARALWTPSPWSQRCLAPV
ncbi:exopolyphosphatase/guanosine-5'-triphosphate,3'-diphosphate pyrophosphatase [Actinoplanes lutulentus]|uniref:Exopolyphosphatase/guanosine-5'-triphosphate, 3'-diphosphate pyrophosphatase n=1 Tax=Actinoplanes lutulentus TaxID=1287878 RepID=A0A327Z9G7_9ACTN|nr:Ppx/GppA family phosphatase [Actinoplanes lutulentus]MBB2948632.1 exopolyphosphatase/guanosine-5'-triphosphate,3'-diphosphate pyrophosphatase [Actinoplanes lutulentus]RAK27997.1 exopolyphosphatase/guanosine-5'-triphosphate,3'-diphosphate pyrophosphatase [Actinoplanes lutulentus]